MLLLSQEKFAEFLGTSLSYLNQIENNKVEVNSSTLDKFAKKIIENLIRNNCT
jgi:transcriptional regulator with XRE-family HTH domain